MKLKQTYLPTFLTLFTLTLPLFIFAQSLKPTATKSLYNHICEINKEWQHFKDAVDFTEMPFSFHNDLDRIQTHLQITTNLLQNTDISHLSETQRTKRLQLLQNLEAYWQAGQFPINDLHSHRQPYFVDAKQTHCAVAYLMQQDGQSDLIQKINSESNYAYIKDLVIEYPVIKTWAFENGFTVQELALIQPGYAPAPQNWYTLGNDGGIEGQINVMKASPDGSLLYMAGQFSSVDDVAANSIIAWDGEDWHTLGAGVNGEILAMDAYGSKLFVAGNFMLNQDTSFSNIAVWDGTNWEGLQQGEMYGSVKTIYTSSGSQLTVGGDFEMIDGGTISYLAKRSLLASGDNSWHNYVRINLPGPNNYDTIYNAFAVNGPVNNIRKIENRLLISGEFTQTAPDATDSMANQIETEYMAYWYSNNWDLGFTGPYHEVTTTGYDEGKLYLGSNMAGSNSISVLTAGFWGDSWMSMLDTSASEIIVAGFIRHLDKYYAYGNIKRVPIIGTESSGLIQIGGDFNSGQSQGGGALFDKTVRACEVFQDNLYFAGDFTNFANGLVYSPMDGLTSTVEHQTSNINIYCHNKQLHIKYEDLSQQSELQIYNTQGQPVKSIQLDQGAADLQKNLSAFADGVYFYKLTSGTSMASGKLALF